MTAHEQVNRVLFMDDDLDRERPWLRWLKREHPNASYDIA